MKSIIYSFTIFFALLFLGSANAENDVENIISDMTGDHDTPLLNPPAGVSWATRASIVQGGIPRGNAIPSWWNPSDNSLKSSCYWNAVSPWGVFYPGESHKESNVRLEVDAIEVYLLIRKDRGATWQRITSDNMKPSWASHYSHNLIDELETIPREEDGSFTYKVKYNVDTDFLPIHFGLDKTLIDGKNVLNIMVRMKAYFVADNPAISFRPEDVEYLIAVGADYYPSVYSKIEDFKPTGYNPGIGLSRFRLLSATPQWYHFVAIETSGQAAAAGTFTIDDLRRNPPPSYRHN